MFDGINYYDDYKPAGEQPVTWDDLPECIHHFLTERDFDQKITPMDTIFLKSLGIDPRIALNY